MLKIRNMYVPLPGNNLPRPFGHAESVPYVNTFAAISGSIKLNDSLALMGSIHVYSPEKAT